MRKLYLLFFVLILMFSISNIASAEAIHWQSYSKATFAQAKNQHKLILVFGKTSSCPWCHKMQHETFTNSSVTKVVNSKFIPVILDDSSGTAKPFRINTFPTLIILTPNQKIIKRKTGYLTSSETIRLLNSVK